MMGNQIQLTAEEIRPLREKSNYSLIRQLDEGITPPQRVSQITGANYPDAGMEFCYEPASLICNI